MAELQNYPQEGKIKLNQIPRHLVLHASIILFAALIFGAPYARSIKRSADLQVINSWRVAHQSLTIGALLLFVMAYVLPMLIVPNFVKVTIAVFFILSGYAFTISTPLAAITKDRGLSAGASGLARLVYVGNIVGAFTSLSAAALLVVAAMFCSGLINPDTNLGENSRHREVFDEQAKKDVFSRIQAAGCKPGSGQKL